MTLSKTVVIQKNILEVANYIAILTYLKMYEVITTVNTLYLIQKNGNFSVVRLPNYKQH